MSGRSWFSWNRTQNVHSLERLRQLYSLLTKNKTVTPNNKSLVVETLRSISEILIWGDQNDSSVFEFFLEKNMFQFFINLLNSDPGSHVCIQLLQTLNILFENLRHETSLFYLLSNNHVNTILVSRFDFEDEELLAYYISFLKTLSLRLDSNTVHFFFNEHRADFPLFTEALNFHAHSESMVRAAVRTLTLSVYRVREPALESFLLERTAKPYFSQLVYDCQQIAIAIDTQHETGKVEPQLLNDHMDFLHYFADIISNASPALGNLLIELLLQKLLSVYAAPIFKDIGVDPSFAERRSQFAPAVSLTLMAEVFSLLKIEGLERLSKEMGDWACSQIIASSGFMSKPANLQQQLDAQREIAIRELNQNNLKSSPSTESTSEPEAPPENRVGSPIYEFENFPLLDSCLKALETERNYLNVLPTLLFVNSMVSNLNDTSQLMMNHENPADAEKHSYGDCLFEKLIRLLEKAVSKPTSIRLITVSLACNIIEWLNQNGVEVLDEVTKVAQDLKTNLSIPLRQEELFLNVISEISQTPMSGQVLIKRLPCGADEQLQYEILLFFLLRQLSFNLKNEKDVELPLACPNQLQKVGAKLDLNNAELIGCTVTTNESTQRRFMVVDTYQIILVEPDSKLGWGKVTFAGQLQDLEIEQLSQDERTLVITVRQSRKKSSKQRDSGSQKAVYALVISSFKNLRCTRPSSQFPSSMRY
ncbi:Oidioi.mRNA.OKI2018_I69.PAR.g12170.t1.cds [Oikopleura dioica]|uniref:Oidioi.mRNA.OKI2018_I69.PAR.g12170.t1.cds n=1 Tax=Oikopleura dioica TaxID=34765 RepID=A0ABN7S288_OIKDI|nr:Oidioi.mRNA.OKI2018_I69.PAR.g12170.t1.cds [Oikopleura dioica]